MKTPTGYWKRIVFIYIEKLGRNTSCLESVGIRAEIDLAMFKDYEEFA